MTTNGVGFINFAAEPKKLNFEVGNSKRTDEAFTALAYAGNNKARNYKI